MATNPWIDPEFDEFDDLCVDDIPVCMPEDIWETLVNFLVDHQYDIEEAVNGFGDLEPVYYWLVDKA